MGELVVLDELGEEAPLQRLAGADVASRDEPFERAPGAEQADGEPGRARVRREADPRERRREDGGVGRDPRIAREREREPAPAAWPLTTASTGFSSARIASTFAVSCSRSRSATPSAPALSSSRSWPAQKPRPGAGEDDRPHRGVARFLERDREARMHRRIQRVQTVGPVSVIQRTEPSRLIVTSAMTETINGRVATPTPAAKLSR